MAETSSNVVDGRSRRVGSDADRRHAGRARKRGQDAHALAKGQRPGRRSRRCGPDEAAGSRAKRLADAVGSCSRGAAESRVGEVKPALPYTGNSTRNVVPRWSLATPMVPPIKST